MSVTTVVKTIGSTGTFSTVQLWMDGGPADYSKSNNWSISAHTGTFQQGETITGTGVTGGKFLDGDNSTYITFGTTTTPAAGAVLTGSTSGATATLSGSANVGVIWQGQCQNQEFSVAGVVCTFAGTSSSSAYPELTTVAGASFVDNANKLTNALCYNSANGAALKSTSGTSGVIVSTGVASSRVSKLQMQTAVANAVGFGGTSGNKQVSQCIIEATRTTAGATTGVIRVNGSDIWSNCLIIQRASGAAQIIGWANSSSSGGSLYGCTIVAPDDLATAPTEIFNSSTGTYTIQNCGLFAGDSSKAITAGGGTFNFTTCYSDISGTTGVTQTTYTNEFQDVNDATRDFRLKSGASQIDTGTTDATNEPTDIVGTSRPQGSSYDVGCWEYAAATGNVIKTWQEVADANVKTYNGIARAGIKTWNGVAAA